MKFTAKVGDHLHEVEVRRENGWYVVVVDGQEHRADARKLEGDFYSILMENRSYEVSVEADGDRYRVRHGASEQEVVLTDAGRRARERLKEQSGGPVEIRAVMPGRVVRVLVDEGEAVEEGQGLLVLEAMKMENEIAAPAAGRVQSLAAAPGDAVEAGALLAVLLP